MQPENIPIITESSTGQCSSREGNEPVPEEAARGSWVKGVLARQCGSWLYQHHPPPRCRRCQVFNTRCEVFTYKRKVECRLLQSAPGPLLKGRAGKQRDEVGGRMGRKKEREVQRQRMSEERGDMHFVIQSQHVVCSTHAFLILCSDALASGALLLEAPRDKHLSGQCTFPMQNPNPELKPLPSSTRLSPLGPLFLRLNHPRARHQTTQDLPSGPEPSETIQTSPPCIRSPCLLTPPFLQ